MKEVVIRDQELILHPSKSIYWKNNKTLLIADFHIGKSAHFRRNGFPVHTGVDQVNLKNLFKLLNTYPAEHLIFLGDLFHNKVNREWEVLQKLLSNFQSLAVSLVLGNHDLLSTTFYQQMNIEVFPIKICMNPFVLTHKPLVEPSEEGYHLAGHLHPGIVLRGKGRQSVRLPCFYFNEYQGIMPAFGEFTGMAMIRPKKNDQVYVVTDRGVVDV